MAHAKVSCDFAGEVMKRFHIYCETCGRRFSINIEGEGAIIVIVDEVNG